MTSITGKIYSVKGSFFILSEKIANNKRNLYNVFEDIDWEDEKSPIKKEQKEPPKEEKKSAPIWRQEESIAKLVISLNLVLNIYVLQIFIDKQPKYNFYINYDLNFQNQKASDLGIEKLPKNKQIYHWKSIIDSNVEYELIVYLLLTIEHKAR